MAEEKKVKPQAVIEKKDETVKEEKKGATKEVKTENEKTETGKDNVIAAPIRAKKKKKRRQILKGEAHIHCTYNNTIITITDINGGVLAWSSAGMLGFKGAKKSTPYAATQVANDVMEKVKKYGIQEAHILIKGVGGGREASIRGLANRGLDILSIKDVTPHPHNGCRPRKPRRI